MTIPAATEETLATAPARPRVPAKDAVIYIPSPLHPVVRPYCASSRAI
jgi:hypothetical protein